MEQQPKIALITGGSRGLGRNAALALAHRGNDVIVTYHSQQAQAESLVQEVRALGRKAAAIRLDAGQTASFDAFKDELLTVLRDNWQRENFDYLINNAGFGFYASIAETTEAQFDELMNVHVKGVFFLTQKLMPHLADHGAIINVSSGLTRFTIPGSAAYAAMKGAVEVLTRYMAKELGARGIRVNTIAPGAIATEFGGGRLKSSEEMQAFISGQTALGRTGQADDIGGVIAALCANEMGWVNAQRIEASGGMFL
ncbi:SDR family NAD(P)-dependent oxidoreductase [Paenibacillus sacheonensis]|uniref:SDR family oxidoreductase n=1 Tax=Paenibacillus sacheonensis TaxID=742054 RepID=A0A7X4YUF0_9BACL|nr:SDR family oxidoreductase [Paenibacillus sacheonensis]MBM7568969.1 NAD(P)-dependent dehydrogenase (short-subunit alcohol dehydrogenase family) [Paenibacillus sacheonensis]NBC72658.1 SDR family oxidoreductase [Paenibacillus sacheonensis]